jgi:hypothetical protein
MQARLIRVHADSKTPYLLSYRRQMRRLAERMMPRLRSGRQWVKYRKALKRQQGFDYLAQPSFVGKDGKAL